MEKVANNIRWNKMLNRYRIYIQHEKRLSRNSVEAYLRDLNQFQHFILHHWDIAPKEVAPEMIHRFLEEWLYTKGREATSQARSLSSIRGFFNFLLLEEQMEASPAEFIPTPQKERSLPDVLSTEEIDQLLDSIDTDTAKGRRDSAMLEVLYSCGLRVSELIALRLRDLFFGEGYIRVQGKGSKQRLVPISRVAQEKVQYWLEDRRERKTSDDILFLNNRNKALSRVMVFNIIKQCAERVGITKHISPHTFRHSFATHLLEGGASIRQVQEMLGHENIQTTEIYTHLNSQHLRETVEKHLPR